MEENNTTTEETTPAPIVVTPTATEYFYPAQGINIEATSKEEADAKLVENSTK